MRIAPWVIIQDLDEPGSVEWFGSLAQFCRANGFERSERSDLYASLRSGRGWRVGGGAAAAFEARIAWTTLSTAASRHPRLGSTPLPLTL